MSSDIDSGSATDSSVEDERQREDIKKFTVSDHKFYKITSRPNASNGYWLCVLLPLALLTHYLGHDFGCRNETYDALVIAGIGMGLESLCFFVYLFMEAHLLQLKLMISLLPGFTTMYLYKNFYGFTWYISAVFGFAITILYQDTYMAVLRAFPNSFTYGEATVIVQGLMLFIFNVALQAPNILQEVTALITTITSAATTSAASAAATTSAASAATSSAAATATQANTFEMFNRIMLFALFCLVIFCLLLAKCASLRKPICFYITMILLALIVTCTPITKPIPLLYIIETIWSDENKLLLILYYVSMLLLTILVVGYELKRNEIATTVTRKCFHFLLLLVYIPGLLTQCALLYIGTGVALALMVLVELLRICEVPPFKETLKEAFQNYKDAKDAGLLALTPFCLMIGCSLPLWIMPCPCKTDCETDPAKMLAIMSGILTVGIGDAAASIVGAKFGAHKWKNTQRSLEGTFAFILAILLTISLLVISGYITLTKFSWAFVIAGTLVSALTEAHTDQIDNLVLPLVFYIIVNLSREI